MIISPGRGYVFVHIPKTGGTALTLALEARALPDDIVIADTPAGRAMRARVRGLRAAGRLWKHSTLADIDGLADLDALMVVTLVRNPWDRMVSYHAWLRVQTFGHPAVARAKALAFGDFLNHPATQAEVRANPVARYLTDAAGRERPALCLRLEHLAADMAPFAAHLGWVPQLARANQSNRPRDWRPFYTDADAALVAALAGQEIARFGYRFDD